MCVWRRRVLEQVTNGYRTSIEKMASDKCSIGIARFQMDNGSIRLKFVDTKFFEGEAAVVLEHLYSSRWT